MHDINRSKAIYSISKLANKVHVSWSPILKAIKSLAQETDQETCCFDRTRNII